jgi:hypothetical protein
MTRTELERAAEELRTAAALLDGDQEAAADEQATHLESLAERESGPDHGRLDRHMNALAELADEVAGDARDHVVAAREHVTEYRKTVEGV